MEIISITPFVIKVTLISTKIRIATNLVKRYDFLYMKSIFFINVAKSKK